MVKELKKNNKYFDKVLLDYRPDDSLWKKNIFLENLDFKYYYNKNDKFSKRVIYGMCITYNKKMLQKHPFRYPSEFYNSLIINQFVYFILKYIYTNKEDITIFIRKQIEKFDFMKLFLRKSRAGYLPSLKWFYSEKTKHLYSKDLLKKMKEYYK